MKTKKKRDAVLLARAEEAFSELYDARQGCDEHDLVHINVDIDAVVGTALSVIPKLNTLLPTLTRELTSFDPLHVDELERRTLALLHAEVLYRHAQSERREGPAYAERAAHTRSVLYDCARLLVTRGHLEESALSAVQRTGGHSVLVDDLQHLIGLFKDRWEDVAAVCGLQQEELVAAQRCCIELMVWMTERDAPNTQLSHASLARQRAYTLFFRSYTDARAAVAYVLRNSGDAGDVLPSLHAGRVANARRKAALEARWVDAPCALTGELLKLARADPPLP